MLRMRGFAFAFDDSLGHSNMMVLGVVGMLHLELLSSHLLRFLHTEAIVEESESFVDR